MFGSNEQDAAKWMNTAIPALDPYTSNNSQVITMGVPVNIRYKSTSS
jgi:hypothetical protein